MILADERILEFLNEEGPRAPSKIAEDPRILYKAQHVGNRCRLLAKARLLRQVGNGVYNITERGKKYLNGELDLSELRKPGEDTEREAPA
jgi:predicted transcriptional regulator